MSRIAEIFLRARDTLNDHQKQRWSDETLLRNLNQGIEDIAIQAKLFKNSIAIPLFNGQEIYSLPDNILEISHATYNWRPIPLVTSQWMSSNREHDWRYTTSDRQITHLVFDEIKRREIRVYPRPFGDFNAEYVQMDSVYGVTTDIDEYTFSSPYGVIGSIVDPDVGTETLRDIYGVLGGIAVADAFIIYYTECPSLPKTVDDEIPVDPCFDKALKHYVTGLALRNDVDVQNRQFGAEELEFYNRDLDMIKELAETDSVAAPWFESHYNPIG